MGLFDLGIQLGMVVVLVFSLVAVRALDGPQGSWGVRLRSRLIAGVPWGSLVVVGLVLAVYLFVQNGQRYWYSPVTLPFTSWSYLYPLGWVTAPFSHSGAGHLTGNLLATAVLAPLAEYAWSHFPVERGSSSFGSWRSNPYVRAFVLFPLGVVVVGIGTSVLHWGPMIGFSGVVFAFAGFALVRYPLATVVALVARQIVGTAYYAVQDPVSTVTAAPSFSRPAWAGIAVQGHLLGLLLGVLVGYLVVRDREERPSALRLWIGTVLVGSSFQLWALWWYRGSDTYVLHRGLGVLLVVTLGLLVAFAVRTPRGEFLRGVDWRPLATALLVFPILVMAMVAVPVNFSQVSESSPPGESVDVGDYTVVYAEGVTNPKASILDVSVFGETTDFRTGGVIVISESREIWTREVSPGQLAFDGTRWVKVGGLGWREWIGAERVGWTPTGNDTVYQVWLLPPGTDDRKHVFASQPSTASPVLAGKNVTLVPDNGSFRLLVSRANARLGTAPLPTENETTTAAGIAFERDGERVVAVVDDTRVAVATRETYE